MDTKEKHIRENGKTEIRESREGYDHLTGNSHEADRDADKYRGMRKINSLWLWIAILGMISILIWWLFSIGIFNDVIGSTNG